MQTTSKLGMLKLTISSARDADYLGQVITKIQQLPKVVRVQADHATLYFGTAKTPPAAWDTVSDRLARR